MPDANSRVTTHVADTSYLICFGGVPNGMGYLRIIFSSGLSAPPVVKWELRRIARHSNKPENVKAAAELFVGKQAMILADIPLEHDDVAERDMALESLSEISPPSSISAGPGVPEQSAEHPVSLMVDNGGEAEAIAICVRKSLPLLMNDGKATVYARTRSVAVQPAPESLRRLLEEGLKTPKELFQICKSMERVGYLGAVVPGPQWFRQPTPAS